MKTLQYRKNLPKLVTLISMGLASVPVESFWDKHTSLISHPQHTLTSSPFNKLVAIPIDDAAEKMNKLATLLTHDLNKLKEEWKKYHYPFITTQAYTQINKNIRDIDTALMDIKMILTSRLNNDIKKRESIILFGRSLAFYRSALNDIISFIKQINKPLKTTSRKPNVSEINMKKLIQLEHIKLGLNKSNFDSN